MNQTATRAEPSSTERIERVAVIGCGELGRELVRLCLANELVVCAVKLLPGNPPQDLSDEAGAGRLTLTHDFSSIRDAQVVIEAAAENVAIKQTVLSAAERSMAADAVLATTTRSLRISELGEVLHRNTRFVGLHFVQPVREAEFVEIAGTSNTSANAIEIAKTLCNQLGKHCLELGDCPGYLVNRLLIAQILHCIELLERGISGVEEIDAAVRVGQSGSIGALTLADQLGLDTVLALAKNLYAEHADARFVPPALLRRLIRRGALGQKSGAGFYVYGSERQPNPDASEMALHALSSAPPRASAA